MNNFKSIKWKLITMYLGLVLIVMIVSGSYILLSLRNAEYDKTKHQLSVYAKKISEQVVLSYDEADFQSGFDEFIKNNFNSELEGNILDNNGNILATSSTALRDEFSTSVVISAINGNESFSTAERDSDRKEWIVCAYPVKINEDVKYIVYTRTDATNVTEGILTTTKTIVVAVFLALLLTAVMGYAFANSLTIPILTLTGKAKELAEGNLNQKMTVQSEDEIGQLTQTFNYMAEKLSKSMKEISKEKNKLEVILHNMTDGVIAFDSEGNLSHVNTVALDMLEITEMPLTFTNFSEKYEFNINIYLELKNNVTKETIFPVSNKYIKATFSPFFASKKDMGGIIVVLADITEQKKLDDMRKEFVANVSHELRTPLTTVKSYTETLMDGAISDKEIAMEFLSIINTEADRMAFLVRDLLQLSRFDNHQIQLNYTNIDLNELMEENIRQSKIHAENKNQSLTFIPYKNNIIIRADRERINQVINNILTNSIKYSLQNDEIKSWIEEDEKYYKVIVKDTGIGITKEDLNRIFERFYRADKARSRAMGGTGLGLAIAKEIMENHGGKITAESEYGKGTKMTLWFLKGK